MNGLIDIILGDAIEKLKTLEDNSVDLIVTDPPYNLGKNYGSSSDTLEHDVYLDFSREWLTQCKRVLKSTGTIYVFMGMQYISYLYAIMEKELSFTFNSWITWYYTQGIGKTKGFSPRHDDILMFTKESKNFTFNLDEIRVPQKYYRSVNNMRGANPGNVWEFSHIHYCNKSRKPHPTQKPEGLYERMILASSNEGDIVLDPFSGSGTCANVCLHTSRRCICIDNHHEYIDMTKQRLSDEFKGFDSIDEKMFRVPNDLNDTDIRIEYLKKHVEWFLKNHDDYKKHFVEDVKRKYGKKLTDVELEFLNNL